MALVLPSAYNRCFTVCGFDPGINNLGFSKLLIDCETNKVVSVWADTIRTNRLLEVPGYQIDIHGEHSEKILKLHHAVAGLLRWAVPNYVASESPFYNPSMPAAFGSLTEIVQMLRMTTFIYDPNLPFMVIPPSLVKKNVDAGAISGKDAVRHAVCNHPELSMVSLVNMTELDEHAIDAIAVAYAHFKLHLQGG